jgi:hypothetical protein
MRPSFIVAVVIATAVGISITPILLSSVWAQGVPGVPSGSQGAKPAAPPSLQQSAGQLKTDAGKTKDDVKAMDVMKTQQDAGQVKKDATDVQNSAKDLLTNPLGK